MDRAGVARAKDLRALHEPERIADVRSIGFVPDDVGDEVVEAPARGPVRMFEGRAMVRTETGGFASVKTGYAGRKTLQRADSFDVMAAKAARHGRPSPFTPSQIAMGRFYRDLVEKHASAGVKCSSLESLSQRSAGSGSDYMDAVLRDRERIGGLRMRIGSGSAMVVRRNRPSARGSRVTITDRRLVDIVCLEDGTITDVLRAHGWAIKGELVKSLVQALAKALDRMMGPVQRGGTSVAQFGTRGVPRWD
ncbi:hypothetical protein J7426_23520 [Tropicibacter sp. R16_0]|nr:hypothetical protein [Tropicibacter sp. R16_0]